MLSRIFLIFYHLLPLALSFALDRRRFLLFGPSRQLGLDEHRRRAKELVEALSRLGPTFIKLAQILSARPDLVPKVYLEELSKLQDRCPALPFEVIAREVEGELGKPLSEAFEGFERESLAAASLGQVHRARYRGEEVAVKVLRPGVRGLVELDLRIVGRLLGFLLHLIESPHLENLSVTFQEFSRMIREEMDFVQEANNAERFRENLSGVPGVIIPRVYRELCTGKVLVLEYFDGVKVNCLEELEGRVEVAPLMERLLEVYARQMLLDGFFHADPHPGNILVNSEGEIIFLDFGMAIWFDEETRDRLVRLAAAAARRDVEAMVELGFQMGMVDETVNPALLEDAARQVVEIIDKRPYTKLKIEEKAMEILESFSRFPFRLPPNMVYLFKTTTILEGIGVKYDPNFDMAKAMRPVVNSLLGRRELAREPFLLLRERLRRLRRTLTSFERVIQEMDRGEFRVRPYPPDVHIVELYFRRMWRKGLLLALSLLAVLTGGLGYLSFGGYWMVVAGFLLGALFLVLALLLPQPRIARRLERKRKG
ncbi:MAG: ABC1 kinase family protein [Nitrospinota bacterium]